MDTRSTPAPESGAEPSGPAIEISTDVWEANVIWHALAGWAAGPNAVPIGELRDRIAEAIRTATGLSTWPTIEKPAEAWEYRLSKVEPGDWTEWTEVTDGKWLAFSWIIKPAHIEFRRRP